MPWSWKGRAIPLLPLRAVRPVQSLSACTRVHFTLPQCLYKGALYLTFIVLLPTRLLSNYSILRVTPHSTLPVAFRITAREHLGAPEYQQVLLFTRPRRSVSSICLNRNGFTAQKRSKSTAGSLFDYQFIHNAIDIKQRCGKWQKKDQWNFP